MGVQYFVTLTEARAVNKQTEPAAFQIKTTAASLPCQTAQGIAAPGNVLQ